MSIQYKIKTKSSVITGDKQTKYYAVPARHQRLEMDTICKMIENRCTLTKADIHASMVALAEVMKEQLGEGNSISIDGLGIFSLSISSSGEESPKDITPKKVFTKKICFRPSKDLRFAAKQMTFELSKRNSK